MAGRSVVIEVITDTRQAQRGFNQLSGSAKKAERDLNHTFRGVVSGSGVLRGLGRSLAFASTGFLAFASVSEALRTSVDAATEAAATQRQLAAQFKTTGLSLRDYHAAIEETANRLSNLSGFTRDALEQSFLFAFRGTRNVAQALKIEAAAADVARGRHVGLQQATLAVTKGVTQNATALKRLGIAIPANIKGFEVLTFVQQRFAGQARAGTTAQERLGAALHNLAESAGLALLPTINRVATQLAAWASKTENQKRLQRDLTQTLNSVKGAADAVAGAFRVANRVTGSWEHTLRLLLALGAAAKLRQMAAALGLLEAAAAGGGAAAGARGAGGRGALGGIRALPGVLFAGIADQTSVRAIGIKDGTQRIGSKWYVVKGGRVVGGPFDRDPRLPAVSPAGAVVQTSGAATPGPHNVPAGLFAHTGRGGGNDAAAAFRQLIVPYRLRLEAARAAVTATLSDDVKAAQDEKRWLTRLIASGRLRGKALLDAYDELSRLNSTIASAQTSAAKKAADSAKQAADEAKQRLADARAAFADASSSLKDTFKGAVDQVQGIIGDLFAGPVLAPTSDQIKRRLGVRIAGTSVGALTSDVQAQTAQANRFFADLARLRKRGAPQSLISSLMQAGLADAPEAHALAGASPAALRRFLGALRARDRLAGRVAMTTPEVRIAAKNVRLDAAKLDALGGGHGPIYLVLPDGQVLATVVSKHQQRTHRRQSTQRRGTG